MVTKERFAEGLTLAQYVERMGANQERFRAALARAAATPPDPRILERLGRPRKVLVITEDWCGTSLVYVPIVAGLVAGDTGIDLRVFLRDENPDIMDQYLKRGLYRSIPVFAFFDEEMNELARFIEEAPE
ncbi:MAG TPA: thioredoxin family protein [Candidatus Binatia bacterium]|nr:thioredoxin family protein [Candidatus Binatia bacterium]